MLTDIITQQQHPFKGLFSMTTWASRHSRF